LTGIHDGGVGAVLGGHSQLLTFAPLTMGPGTRCCKS